MIASIIKLLAILGQHSRLSIAWLALLMLIGSILEAVGIGLILPFIKLIEDPQAYQHISYLAPVYGLLDQHGPGLFVTFMGVGLFAFIVLKNVVLAFNVYLRNHILFSIKTELTSRLFARYIGAPYAFHVERNSTELIKNVTSTVGVVINALFQVSNLVTELVTVVVIGLLLMSVAPVQVIIAFAVLAVLIQVLLLSLRRHMTYWGQQSESLTFQIIKWVSQGLGSIKEVKVLGREQYFLDRFKEPVDGLAGLLRRHDTAMEMPRFILEAVLVGGLILSIGISAAMGENVKELLPLLGLFAVAIIRLMPSATRIVSAANGLKFSTRPIELIYDDLFGSTLSDTLPPAQAIPDDRPFSKSIELQNLTFCYEGVSEATLRDISLTIKAGEFIGLVGTTGAGKTTLVDLLLGLHQATEGRILVDGVNINDQMGWWRQHLGYVPQSVYLLDDTLRRNIALGLPNDQIDQDKIFEALKLAHLDQFVQGLPDGLETEVGEMGVKLSGGQRQRIGIARALYNSPNVLILDEAMSSLDGETEHLISQALSALHGKKTMLAIAHRLSTVQKCDRLIFLEGGKISASGTFEELIEKSDAFRRLVELGALTRDEPTTDPQNDQTA